MNIQISKHLHAGADYLSDQKNMLMILAAAPLAVKGYPSVLGKDCSQYSWIGRAGSVLPSLFLLGDAKDFIRSLIGSESSFKKELDAYEKFYCAKDGEENQVIEKLREGGVCFPKEKQGWWAVARAVANLSGALSCFMAVYGTLGGAALKHSPSAGWLAAGSFAGAISTGLNGLETYRKVSDDEFNGVYFSDRDVKEEDNKAEHRDLFKTNSQLELVGSTAMFFLKIVGGLAALHQVANVPESLKNVTQLASAYREKIIGGLFTSYVVWKGIQHLYVGFDKKQLENDKKDTSQNWVRLVAVTADIANDHGLSPIGLDLGWISGNATLLDKVYYPANAFKGGIKCAKIFEFSMEGLGKSALPAMKFVGKVAGTVGLLGAFHLYVFDPQSKMAGGIKNICSLASAAIDLFTDGLAAKKAWDDNRGDKWQKTGVAALTGVISLFSSIPLNGIGYIQNAVPEALKAAGGPEVPKAALQFFRFVGAVAGIAKDEFAASAA